MQVAQRPSGLIDLLSVNYDSAPDTAFTVQALCTLFELVRPHGHRSDSRCLMALETFVRRTIPGLLTGGFHTPNHRWVIVSAMLQAKGALSRSGRRSDCASYLAEGIDIDAEGMFIERSVGVYDAVNDRSCSSSAPIVTFRPRWPPRPAT